MYTYSLLFINGYIVILFIRGINLINLVSVRYRIKVDTCYTTYNINSYGRQRTTCTSAVIILLVYFYITIYLISY